MQIAIASGKGGTGKTTMSLAISHFLSSRGNDVTLLDCDVEEPNAGLFMHSGSLKERRVTTPVPEIDPSKCIGCGVCEELCQYNALAVLKGKAVIFPELCHSCGGCVIACSSGAMKERDVEIGTIFTGSDGSITHLTGKLDIGKIQSPGLIGEVKKEKKNHIGKINIIDSPPGNSCPMIETVRECDHVFLVAEPSPFSMNDLELAMETLDKMGLKYSVIVNKAKEGENELTGFLEKRNTEIAAVISDSLDLAVAYSSGNFIDLLIESEKGEFEKIEEIINSRRRIVECQ